MKGQVINASGDGPNNRVEYAHLARDRAVAGRLTINGLAIISDHPCPGRYPSMANLGLFYEDFLIGGPGAFLVVAIAFEDFARATLREMILGVSGCSPPPERLYFTVTKPGPACNVGELQLEKYPPPNFGDNETFLDRISLVKPIVWVRIRL